MSKEQIQIAMQGGDVDSIGKFGYGLRKDEKFRWKNRIVPYDLTKIGIIFD